MITKKEPGMTERRREGGREERWGGGCTIPSERERLALKGRMAGERERGRRVTGGMRREC